MTPFRFCARSCDYIAHSVISLTARIAVLIVALLLSSLSLSETALADGLLASSAPSHISAQLLVEHAPAPGSTVSLAIFMHPENGWHGYWIEPGDAGYPLRIVWHLPAGVTAGPLAYPVPQTLKLAGLMNHVYERDYALLVPLSVPASAVPGSILTIRGEAEWLACSASICVPEHASLSLTVPVAAPHNTGASDPRFDLWRAAMPAPLGASAHVASEGTRVRFAIPLPASVALHDPHLFIDADGVVDFAAPQQFSRSGDVLVVDLARSATGNGKLPAALPAVLRLSNDGSSDTGLAITATPGPVPADGTPIRGSKSADTHIPPLPMLLLAAIAGGLLLNIMPCVFPILSLKALSLARAGESQSQARAEGVAYSAGVITATMTLGVLLLVLRAAGSEVGWAFQLQQPAVVVVLLLLSVAITANLAGLYELAIPGFAQSHANRGSFATGLLAAFVATPCTGPFMASAMGAALLLPPASAMLLFISLGFGLALPFLAIAFVPALRRLLPRPGAWMVWFRKAMAVPMALTALALAWLATRLGGSNFAAASLVLALVLLGLLVLVGARQRQGYAVARMGMLASIVLGASAIIILPRLVRAPDAKLADILPSQPYSEAALTRALASGKPVFAFFSADWCLTCKVNERLSIERTSTRDAFAKAGVIVLEGDWTRRAPAITHYLTAHGAAGVPLYVWYPAHRAGTMPVAQILPQVLTPDSLINLTHQPQP